MCACTYFEISYASTTHIKKLIRYHNFINHQSKFKHLSSEIQCRSAFYNSVRTTISLLKCDSFPENRNVTLSPKSRAQQKKRKGRSALKFSLESVDLWHRTLIPMENFPITFQQLQVYQLNLHLPPKQTKSKEIKAFLLLLITHTKQKREKQRRFLNNLPVAAAASAPSSLTSMKAF